MKTLLITLLCALVLVPSTLFAQTTSSLPPSLVCTQLTYGLYQGSTDATTSGEVTKLQNFLVAKGFLVLSNSSSFGIFGPITSSAVRSFQSVYGVPQTGSVGPISRAKIAEVSCGVSIPTPPTIPPVNAIQFTANEGGDEVVGQVAIFQTNGTPVKPVFLSGYAPYFQLTTNYYNVTVDMKSYYNGAFQSQSTITGQIKVAGSLWSLDTNTVKVGGKTEQGLANAVVTAVFGNSSIDMVAVQGSYSGGIKIKLFNGSGSVVAPALGIAPGYKVPVGIYTVEVPVTETNQPVNTIKAKIVASATGYKITDITEGNGTIPPTTSPITLKSAIDGTFIQVWIVGNPANTKVTRWTSSVSCSAGLVILGKYDQNICEQKDSVGPWYDQTKDILIYTVFAKNTTGSNAGAKFYIRGDDAYGNFVGDATSVVTVPPATNGTQPTVSVVGTPTLKLTYDSLQKESSLVAGAQVKVVTGPASVKVPLGGSVNISVVKSGTNIDANVPSPINTFVPSINLAVVTSSNGFERYYVIPPNTSVTFSVTRTLNPKQMFAGTYTAKVNDIYFINDNNQWYSTPLPANSSNAVTIIGETSPYITSVTPTVKAGDIMTIIGTRFYPTASIYLDGVLITPSSGTMSISDGTKLSFTVPSTWTAGQHNIQVANASGRSNIVWFTVTTGTTQPPTTGASVSVVGTPTLKLVYNSAQKESSLNASYTVKIVNGNQPFVISGDSIAIQLLRVVNGAGQYVSSSPVTRTFGSLEGLPSSMPSTFTIPANTTATFTLTLGYNPLQMFAGTYYAILNGVSFPDRFEQTLKAPSTNQVTIVGERSAYLNSITTPVDVNGKVTVQGVRIYNGDTAIIDKGATSFSITSSYGTNFSFTPAKYGLTAGQHSLQVTNPTNGASNIVWFTVTTSGTPVVPSVTVTSPNGGETWVANNWQTVTWRSTGVDPYSPMLIQMIDTQANHGYGLVRNIDKPVAMDGKFTFLLNTNDSGSFPSGNRYKVRVSVLKDSTPLVVDDSDNYFTVTSITPPTTVSAQIDLFSATATAGPTGPTGSTTVPSAQFVFRIRPIGGSIVPFRAASTTVKFSTTTSLTTATTLGLSTALTIQGNPSVLSEGVEYMVTVSSVLNPNVALGRVLASGASNVNFYLPQLQWVPVGGAPVTQINPTGDNPDSWKTNNIAVVAQGSSNFSATANALNSYILQEIAKWLGR